MSTYKNIIVRKKDGIATILLNRPEVANGLNLETGQELYEACCEVEEDTIRVVVLSSVGKFFSVGGDLKYMQANKSNIGSAIKKLATLFHRVLLKLASMKKPVIMGINGMAAGGGFSLAMTGDLVVAAESAKFVSAYTSSGLSPDGGSSYLLPRLIGIRRATELILTNRQLSAEEALEWNLINKVVPDDQLETTLQQLAKQLVNGPTPAFASVKKLLLASAVNDYETQMNMEAELVAINAAAPHGLEGINAFLEKRKPNFFGS